MDDAEKIPWEMVYDHILSLDFWPSLAAAIFRGG
jgi:hypothetical protein